MTKTITIEARPNAWGFYGKQNRTGYAVMVDGVQHACVCYLRMAEEIVARLGGLR